MQHRSRHRVRRRPHCAVSPLAYQAGQGERHCNTTKYPIRSCIALFDLLLTKREELSRRRCFTARTHILVSLALSPSLTSSLPRSLIFPRSLSFSMQIYICMCMHTGACAAGGVLPPEPPQRHQPVGHCPRLRPCRLFPGLFSKGLRAHTPTHTHMHVHMHMHMHMHTQTPRLLTLDPQL